MKGRQIQKVNMFLSVAQLCHENIAIIAMMQAMLHNAQELDKKILSVIDKITKQSLPIKPHRIQKMEIRRELSRQVDDLAAIARSYGHLVKSPIIYMAFELHTYTNLMRMRQNDLSAHATNLHKFLSDNIACLRDFNVRKTHIENLKRLIDLFRSVQTKPSLAIDARKCATQLLSKEIAETDNFIKNQMDTLHAGFRNFPEFSISYKEARKQIKYGRPKETLKNKIKKYQKAPALPRGRRSKKSLGIPQPIIFPEMTASSQNINLESIPGFSSGLSGSQTNPE